MSSMNNKKEALNIALLGHVDCGKSTIGGHLLYLQGEVAEDTMKKLEQQSNLMGKPSFKYAWVFDTLQKERERGITIENSYQKLQTPNFMFTIIDTPGHRDFIKSTIMGTYLADYFILVVACSPGEFQAGISKQGQTRIHSVIAFTLGSKQLIVCLNKMDDKYVDYSENRFNQIKDEVSSFLKKVGFAVDKVPFIPISGYFGDNLVNKSQKMPWYRGPTLIEALKQLRPVKRYVQKPLRIPIVDVYKIAGVGTVAIGKVETGVLKVGMKLNFAPTAITAQVKSIEINHSPIQQGLAGEFIGFAVKNVAKKDLKKGFVCIQNALEPPGSIQYFTAQIIILEKSKFVKGFTPMVYCHTSSVACKVTHLQSKLDRKTGKVIEVEPQFLQQGDAGIIEMVPTKPTYFQAFVDFPKMGRFLIMDNKQLIAAGVIKKVKKSQKTVVRQ